MPTAGVHRHLAGCDSYRAPRKAPLSALLTLLVVALLAGLVSAAPQAAAQQEQVTVPKPGQCQERVRMPKRDFRAMWIATVVNVDWPSRSGLSVERQQEELRALLDLAVRNNFNAVVLQVRPAADAFWPSPLEPWSTWLTGKQGQDPGYDPLAYAVQEAHRRNLALHAWFNPYRVSMNKDLSSLAPSHPARQHPDWVIAKDGRLYYDPGNPQVRAFVVEAIMDAVTRYDVDGVHFDDYFYPYPGSGKPFKDDASFAAYGSGAGSRADWRRANVDALIKELADRIDATKPWVQFGVSPFAVWRNASTDPEGSATRAGVETYDDLYADVRTWVREGWIDYVAPQVYWPRGFTIADYAVIVPWWVKEVRQAAAAGHRVGLFVGEATYRAGSNDDRRWRKPGVFAGNQRFTAQFPEVLGNIYFSAKDVRADRRGSTTRLVQRWYSRPALPPLIGELPDSAPNAPEAVQRKGDVLTWQQSQKSANPPVSYAIYRVSGDRVESCDLADARNLVATVRASDPVMRWQDSDALQRDVRYAVTAVDAYGLESAATVQS
ncbi:MAG: family 10 glycosylhydrolase [Actinomycetales bacterium]|nr:family 10 glycosylhydrolase [Actinomycetales bacterium]